MSTRVPRGVVSALMLAAAVGVWADEGLVETGRLPVGRVDWLALEGDRLVYGVSARVEVALAAPRPEARGQVGSGAGITSAVAAGNLLLVAGPAGRIERLRLDRPADGRLLSRLDPQSAGDVLLGRTGDYLVVAEQDRGIRLFEIVVPHSHHGESREPGDLVPAGHLDIRGRWVGVASSGATVYLGIEGGRVAIVDASDPFRPTLTGEVDAGSEIRALAAAGSSLFVVGPDSLRLLEVQDGAARAVDERPLAGGRAIEVAGRAIFVATDEGIVALRDARSTAATFNVTVGAGSNTFNPAQITIDPGDTVSWNKGVTGVSHNVESCDGVTDPAGCMSVVATETFRSGNATTAAFTFPVTFDVPGVNPYFCVIHEGLGMRGRVTVRAPVSPPPGVPDGPPGTAMLVRKNDAAGNSLSLSYDVITCTGAADHHIVVGGGSTLPSAPGGPFGVAAATCNIGKTSPFTWASPPTTIDPRGLVWWLIVADDDATVEGSWGKDSAGNERIGPGVGGSSGLCAITAKDLTNTCGQ